MTMEVGIDETRRLARRTMRSASALCAVGLLAGCAASHDAGSSQKVELALEALMADGTLPPGMVSGPEDPVVPPRFCGNGGGMFPGGMFPGGPIGRPLPGIPGPAPLPGPMPAGAGGGDAGMGEAGAGDGAAGMGEVGAGGTAGTGGTGAPSGPDACARQPIGFWRFDDCNETRTDLVDSSFQGHTAFRDVRQQCVAGQEGQAVAFAHKTDLVYAPDQPDFALTEGLTVAAWVRPDRVEGVQTLFRKRDDDNSAFALVIHGKKYQLVVRLASGKLISVSAPATAGRWTHVAATYDREFLRMYIDGHEVAQKQAGGTIAKGPGPLLIGNDASGRRVQGLIDNAWFNTLAAPPDLIMELTCVRAAPELAVSPEVGPAVPGGTAVSYQVSITNNSSAQCPPAQFLSFANVPQELSADPFFAAAPPVASGETVALEFSVSSSEEAEPGEYPVSFEVFSFEQSVQRSVDALYVVAEPTGCHVSSGRALAIRHVSVVDDPVRTAMDGDASDPRTGAWAFGRLMQRLSPTPADAPDLTLDMFGSFLSPQNINGFEVEPRPAMDQLVLASWPRTADGKLDLARAPLRLLAIVNRLDLKNLDAGKAGEGRFVYGVLDPQGFPMEFTVILEYLLPAATEAEYRAWVEAFHGLQVLPFPSEEYNAGLQAITDRFTARGAMPGMPNGSSLIDIRTNEIALSFEWQLREFHISETTGSIEPATLFQTPDSQFNFGDALSRFINANEPTILAETHDVPANFEGAPFQAGAVFNNIDAWFAPGIENPEARHKFSLNTCNGCHGGETNTAFLHISPRFPGEQSSLSGFMTGTTVFDPETGEPRRLAELARRRALMEEVVCAGADAP